MGRLLDQIKDVFLNLFDSQGLMAVLANPEITTAAFIALAIVVFTETGLLVGFCLPGDSLLVTVGIVAWGADWPIQFLIPILCTAAILGNSTGYFIGSKAGPRLFKRDESFFFRKSYLLKAQAFYEKHGGKTIILAQFIPIMRTFAPVVAGIGKMNYRRFVTFNIVGAILWVAGMVLLGYALTPLLDQPLKKVFGEEFQTARHIEKVIVLVVLLSVSPAVFAAVRGWLAKRRTSREAPSEEVGAAV
jgi:membrane-associated protein